jgi:hypothetical protein
LCYRFVKYGEWGDSAVNLTFEWQAALTLTRNKRIVITDHDLNQIEDWPGVYYFARSFGNKSQPFYIGETLKLRARLRGHLDTTRIADILRGMKVRDAPEISNGPRSFHFAYLDANKNKENTKKALQIAQKFMISEAIALNLPLLNEKLIVIKTHSLTFNGKDVISSIFKKENSVPL